MNSLPETTNEYWEHGGVQKVDLTTLDNKLCSTHEFIVDLEKREVSCNKCGYGGRVMPSTEMTEDSLIINGSKHKVINILNKPI